ncbi:MAG: deoxyguanosinetriphosphate triphosphohydrolase [Alphaproteobacteria bacterium]|nr:deoxyguanosinetriphosphate triphosphohydrolase [Alphaproteobacteria bacterium]
MAAANSLASTTRSMAPFACLPERSRGRLFPETESATRTRYQRDRDRIIHCAAFRRLEYKTQVFVNHEGDYYRTRLTHSLEVAQLARSIARELGLDDDLAEALALAHDLGHTPFGHAGEDALNEVMLPYGGFDHNAQTIRILTRLEQRYAGFDGLNLTWETLEGIAKHNGPLVGPNVKKAPARAIAEFNATYDLGLSTWPSAEAQLASLADDIAYNNHDIDDGLRAGLFSIYDLLHVPFVGMVFNHVSKLFSDISEARLIHESIRRIINLMVTDLVVETRRRIKAAGIQNVDDVRAYGKPVVSFSEEMQANNTDLKEFLMQHMYRHYKVNRMSSKARRVVRELFTLFLNEPECLPTEWRTMAGGPKSQQTAEVVCDFIAGMTDRFAIQEHQRLFEISETN